MTERDKKSNAPTHLHQKTVEDGQKAGLGVRAGKHRPDAKPGAAQATGQCAHARKTRASRARTLALDAITRVRERGAFAHDVIESIIEPAGLQAQDAAFATRLVLGVVQMQPSLDFMIDKAATRPRDLAPAVRDALRLSTYEIIFLNKDKYAAVDQGVELVKAIAPKAGGLANAVLRKIARQKDAFPFGDPHTDPAAFALKFGLAPWLVSNLAQFMDDKTLWDFARASCEPAPIYIAVNTAKITFDRAERLLVKADAHATAVVARGVRLPGALELKNRRAPAHPAVARALAEGKIFVTDASAQTIAHLTAAAAIDAFIGEGEGRGAGGATALAREATLSAAAAGATGAAGAAGGSRGAAGATGAAGGNRGAAGGSRGAAGEAGGSRGAAGATGAAGGSWGAAGDSGFATTPAADTAAAVHSPSPTFTENLRFLELCAGRGTKTMLIQNAFLRTCGSQLANYTVLDNHAFKLDILRRRAGVGGINVSDFVCGDATKLAEIFDGKRFDCIFLDAPCTGLGTLRRHPEIRNRLTPQKIAEAAELDARLLTSAASVLAPGGVLVYSTCTVTPAECEGAVAAFLNAPAGAQYSLVAIDGNPAYKPKLVPGGPDAHFCAILKS